ncbi:hypothetical protein [Dyella humicola]|uniref:hypothetical protein n=1 Tax=Dyella humicola TaxID=2992126 RepID=UPI002250343D|nr:hypothetical protein [Dyella humicola]
MKLKAIAQVAREKFDNTCRRVAVGSGLVAFGGMAFAAGDEVDVTDVLAKIAAGVAAGLLVSVAMTGAILGMKASKLPRRGG